MTDADECFLDDLFESCLSQLTEGQPVQLEGLLGGREHLRGEAQAMLKLAASAAVGWVVPSKRLGDYEILRELGHGASGSVYLARQERLGGREVALKVLARSAWLSETSRARFLAEARALARLSHPNIVTVYDVVDAEGFSAYSMEWVAGGTLASWIRDAGSASAFGSDRVPFVCRVGVAMGLALEEVHQSGLLHRDVKPSNILLSKEGEPLLSDFGLARDAQVELHTRTGAFLGTLAYAAPEQLRGDAVDSRSDVYGLGATLYHALVGEPPLQGRSTTELLGSIERGALVPLRQRDPGLPRELEWIISKAMDPDAGERYASAQVMAEDLGRLLALRPVQAQRPSMWRRTQKLLRRNRRALKSAVIGAIASVLLLLGLAFWMQQRAGLPARAQEELREARLSLLEIGAQQQAWLTLQAGGERTPLKESLGGAGEALGHYRNAQELWPGQGSWRVERDVVAAFIGQSEVRSGLSPLTSLPLTQGALQALPQPPSRPDSWEAYSAPDLRAFGLVAYLSGDLSLAVSAWRLLERSQRLDAFIEGMMAQLLLLDGEGALAYPRLLRASEAFPESGKLWLAAADAAVLCGDLDVAERLLQRESASKRRARATDRTRVEADLAWCRGDLDQAQTLYASIHNNFLANLRRGQLAEARGNPTFAVRNYMQNVRTYPRNLSYRRELLRGANAFWGTYTTKEQQRVLRQALDGDVQRYGSLLGLANLVDSSRLWLEEQAGAESAVALFQVQRAGARDVVTGTGMADMLRGARFVDLAARMALAVPDFSGLVLLDDARKDAFVELLFGEGTRPELSAFRASMPPGPLDESRAAFSSLDWGEAFGIRGHGHSLFGGVLAVAGDLDGDGHLDLIIGDRGVTRSEARAGTVGAYSGWNGELLYQVSGAQVFDDYGSSMDGLGADLDDDGVTDWLVGAPQVGKGLPGYVELRDGQAGELLGRLEGHADGDLFGFAVAGLGHLDLTSEPYGNNASSIEPRDPGFKLLASVLFVVGAPGDDGAGLDAGKTSAYRGDGSLLWEQRGHAGDFFGETLVNLGDLDGDGVSDLAAGTFNDGTEPGYVLVLSGRTGAVLHRVGSDIERISFPTLGRTGDVDGDGVPDFAVGVAHDFHLPRPGRVHVFSGKSGAKLWTLEGTRPYEHHCMRVSGVGDLDGDGKEELAVTSWNPRTLVSPTIHLYSGQVQIAAFPGWQAILPLFEPGAKPGEPRRWALAQRGLYSDYLDPLRAPDGQVQVVESPGTH